MDINITWIQPLILLPGVALLIVSTSSRFSQVQTEVHHLLMDDFMISLGVLKHLEERIVLFRNSLTSLYISIALFALGSIFGVMFLPMGQQMSSLVVVVFTGVGIASLLIAVLGLIRESLLSTEILHDHVKHLRGSNN